MFTALLVFHAIIALLLIIVVLIQPGKGDTSSLLGGGSASSAFGADTGAVLTKTTAILGALFMLNSLILSVVGSKLAQENSVVEKIKVEKTK
ncbi:MAG: preprotein translocase subunit SecG [Desulfurobacterium sp.]|nr:MAG: preprotein translocase subunit SecG [Desulfurobacterium sp.]